VKSCPRCAEVVDDEAVSCPRCGYQPGAAAAPPAPPVTAPHAARLAAWLLDGLPLLLVALGLVVPALARARLYLGPASLGDQGLRSLRDAGLSEPLRAVSLLVLPIGALLGAWMLKARPTLLGVAVGLAAAWSLFSRFVANVFVAQLGLGPVYGMLWSALYLLSLVTALVYWLVKDGLGERASLGKALCGLRVVRVLDGAPCTPGGSALRALVAWLLGLLPLAGALVEPIAVLVARDARRLGDRAAGTRVIRG
jgi:uncharacterized RDD family membrane protein YckC